MARRSTVWSSFVHIAQVGQRILKTQSIDEQWISPDVGHGAWPVLLSITHFRERLGAPCGLTSLIQKSQGN